MAINKVQDVYLIIMPKNNFVKSKWLLFLN